MEREESAIAQECASGNFQNFNRLYDAYVRKIHDFMYFRTYHRQTAEDLTSLTFTKVVEHFNTYKPVAGSFSTWLYRIARNTLYDHYRTSKMILEFPETWEIASGEHLEKQFDARQTLREVREYLNTLPRETRDIVLLRVWDGLSYAEISRIVGKSESACKMSMMRTVQKLKVTTPYAMLLLSILSKI